MKKGLEVVFFLLSIGSLFAQSQGLGNSFIDVSLSPGAVVPLFSDSDLYSVGVGGTLAAALKVPRFPFVHALLETGYARIPVRAEGTLSLLPVAAGVEFRYDLAPRWEARAGVSAGGAYGLLRSEPFLGQETLGELLPYLSARLGGAFFLTESFSLGAETSYSAYWGLLQALTFAANGTYHIPPRGRGPLEIKEAEVERLFPAMYRSYEREPPGRVTVRNSGRFPVSGLEVSFLLDPYMSRPTQAKVPLSIPPGEERQLPIKMLFNDRLLGVVEGAKFSGRLRIEYESYSKRQAVEQVIGVEILDRNSLTWEDDRKAALFISEKDPAALEFAGCTAAAINSSPLKPITPAFRMAAALYALFSAYGLTYVPDPRSPYAALSKDRLSVDFLKFPRQTLMHRTGDCDDLSILYCALLESVNLESAFITVPGHIFPAVSLGLNEETAMKLFSSVDDLIFLDGKTWLPVEITELGGGFLMAWELAARQWRVNRAKGSAQLYSVREAWKTYAPVGLAAGELELRPPSEQELLGEFDREIVRFIDRELEPKVKLCLERIRDSGSDPKEINTLGVLYARYALHDKAEQVFLQALESKEYFPSLVNLANLYVLRGGYEQALQYYERAYALDANSSVVLLGLAIVHFELELYGKTREYYEKLKLADSELAGRYAFLAVRTKAEVRSQSYVSFGRELPWAEP